MIDTKINHSIIKIVGLLGEYPTSLRKSFQFDLVKNGYKEDVGSANSEKILKDIFYPDFRSLMFIKNDDKNDVELLSRRFYSDEAKIVGFVKRDRDKRIIDKYNIHVVKSEIFFFW